MFKRKIISKSGGKNSLTHGSKSKCVWNRNLITFVQ